MKKNADLLRGIIGLGLWIFPLLCWGQLNFEMADEKAVSIQTAANKCFDQKNYSCYFENIESLGYQLMMLKDFDRTLELFQYGFETAEAQQDWKWASLFIHGVLTIHFELENHELAVTTSKKIIAHPSLEKDLKAEAYYRLIGKQVSNLDKEGAYQTFEEAQKFLEGTEDSLIMANIYSVAGRMESAFGNQILGNEYYFKSISYRTTQNVQHLLAQTYHNISRNFAKLNNKAKSKEYIDMAFEIANKEKGKRPKLYHQTLDIYSAHYVNFSENYELAKSYINQCIDYFKERNNPHLMFLLYNRLGIITKRENDLPLAITYLDSAASWAQSPSNHFQLNISYADTYLDQNNLNKAKKYLIAANENLAKVPGQSDNRLSLIALEIKYLKKSGHYQEALALKDKYDLINDSLSNHQINQVIHTLDAKYKKAQQDEKIAGLTKDKLISQEKLKKRNRLLLIGGISLLVLSVFLGIVYNLFKQNKKNKESLAVNNIKLEKALDEKGFLIKEIHHRVKNNLQVISSLLSLQSRFVKDEMALDAIKSGKTRVQSMSLLHQNLYQDDNLQGVDMQDYFQNLTDNLLTTYSNEEKPVVINQQIAPIKLDIDSVVPLGLVANELLTNALKHAFVERADGQLDLILKDNGDSLELIVKDNGIGLPNCELPDRKKSLGTRLIKSFAQKLKAEIIIECNEGTSILLAIKSFSRA